MTRKYVALVTGASRGIGRAISLRLSRSDFCVVVNYRTSESHARSLVEEIQKSNGEAECFQADVTQMSEVRAMAQFVANRFGQLNVLVNNAGRSEDGLLLLTKHEEWWRVFNENVAAVVNCTRGLLPLVLRSRPATVINIASVSGLRGIEGQTAYGAAKSAVIGFTKALAKELATQGVSVNSVAPGPIDTEMYQAVSDAKRRARLSVLPLQRLGRPEEVAELVNFLALGNANFIHGQVIAIDGGASI
jgi:3-oxoacyl-[acyl-carrier protein] reductase